MFSFIRLVIAFVLSAGLTVAAAAIADSQLLLNALIEVGAQASLADRIEMAAGNLGPFLGLYGAFIALAFVIAFPAAALVSRLLPLPRGLVFMAAGGMAIFVMLTLMREAFFGVDLIASARTPLGLGVQIACGIGGGLVFTLLSAAPRRD